MVNETEYRDAEARIWAECRREIRSALVAFWLATTDLFDRKNREEHELLYAFSEKWTPVLEPFREEFFRREAEARSRRDARLELLKRGEVLW